ncbi:Anthranilate N-benzoyltransferase protein 3 [Platanthera guangdongensis]|uniref:Anthranilate N-benzoyltransferase protein 3 n=1 Tax=Platanthera guangdongensis TaxID=2320717 RepID=A0ABR2MS71_9ASPA
MVVEGDVEAFELGTVVESLWIMTVRKLEWSTLVIVGIAGGKALISAPHFSVAPATLRASLSAVLQEYYPLAGRLRAVGGDSEKLELDCNGEGALFVEASSAISVDQFLDGSQRPNKSWRKLLYRLDSQNFISIPPLVIQVPRTPTAENAERFCSNGSQFAPSFMRVFSHGVLEKMMNSKFVHLKTFSKRTRRGRF